MLNFCAFIQVYVFTTNHHLKAVPILRFTTDLIDFHGEIGLIRSHMQIDISTFNDKRYDRKYTRITEQI